MGVSNPTGDVFLPEIIGRKLHLHVPQYVFYILNHEYLENSFYSTLSSLFLLLGLFSFVNYNCQH